MESAFDFGIRFVNHELVTIPIDLLPTQNPDLVGAHAGMQTNQNEQPKEGRSIPRGGR